MSEEQATKLLQQAHNKIMKVLKAYTKNQLDVGGLNWKMIDSFRLTEAAIVCSEYALRFGVNKPTDTEGG